MKKILVIGYFGYLTNQIDGQTIRTRSVYSLLKANTPYNIDFFDTQSFQKSKFNLIKLIYLLLKSDIIFNIAAQGNLRYLLPIIYFITLLTRAKLNYIAVGGWLYEFIKNKPIHRYMLLNIKNIYVQTENLCNDLKEYNFKNVYLLNNFRTIKYSDVIIENVSKPVKRLIFMARVHPLKGVDLLFEVDKILKESGMSDIGIDIYGPIFKDYEKEFFNKIESSSVKYCGVIEPANIYKILSNYDLMLFPTKYFTEGFPGSILDAYISGVPVIATKWLNAEEFVVDGQTGYITEFNDDKMFINKIIYLIKTPNELFKLRQNIKIKRNDYSAETAWKVLENAFYD